LHKDAGERAAPAALPQRSLPAASRLSEHAPHYPPAFLFFLSQELDPTGKFASEAKLWQWNAADAAGKEVEFASACTPTGFDHANFKCLGRKDCSR
jgi:hypothetical protein